MVEPEIALFITLPLNIVEDKHPHRAVEQSPHRHRSKLVLGKALHILGSVVVKFAHYLIGAHVGEVVVVPSEVLDGLLGDDILVLGLHHIVRRASLEHVLTPAKPLLKDPLVRGKAKDTVDPAKAQCLDGRIGILQKRQDALLKLWTNHLIGVEPDHPVSGGLLQTMVDVAIDIVLALDEANIGKGGTNRLRVIIAKHVHHQHFIRPTNRLKGGTNDGSNIVRGDNNRDRLAFGFAHKPWDYITHHLTPSQEKSVFSTNLGRVSNGWHLQFFDGLRAFQGTRVVEHFRDNKASVLLALLVTAPDHARTRESLCEEMWPNIAPKTQRSRLRWLLHVVRAALTEEIIVNEGNSLIRLGPETTSDLEELERLLKRATRSSLSIANHAATLQRLTEFKNQILLPAADDEDLILALRSDRLERIQSALDVLCRPLFPVPVPQTQPDFVGRLAELREVQEWLQGKGRLLSLIGLGGIGKTRLAREALASAQTTFVSLADTTDALGFWDALLKALKLPRQGDGTAHYRVLAHLTAQSQPLILLLDNLEQFGDTITPLLDGLLAHCPQLRLVATSRRATQAQGEQLLRVPPLAQESSVQLFLLRAAAAKPGTSLDPQNPTLRELCGQLQGIALSLELAAARTPLLTLGEILQQLKNQLAFLRTLRPQWSERHRSQQAALQWSYELLSESTRQALRALALFRSPFSLEAAQWLYNGPLLLDALEELHLNSLLITETTEGEKTVFRFLVVVREFGLSCQTSDEAEALGQRHTQYVLHQIRDLHRARPNDGWDEATEIIRHERENLRDVIQRAVGQQDAELLFALVENIAYLYSELGLWPELAQLLPAAQATFTESTSPRLKAYLYGLRAALARRSGDGETAWQCWQMKRDVLQQQGDPAKIATTLMEILSQAIDEDRVDAAVETNTQLTEQLQSLPPHSPPRVMHEVHQIRFQERQGASEETLKRARTLLEVVPFSDWSHVVPSYYLAPVFRRLGDVKQAEALLTTALQYGVEKHFHFLIGSLALEFAYVKEAQGEFAVAGEAFLIARELNRRLDSRRKGEADTVFQEFLNNPSLPEQLRESLQQKQRTIPNTNSEALIKYLFIGD